jgi:hypothetical protein
MTDGHSEDLLTAGLLHPDGLDFIKIGQDDIVVNDDARSLTVKPVCSLAFHTQYCPDNVNPPIVLLVVTFIALIGQDDVITVPSNDILILYCKSVDVLSHKKSSIT